LGYYDIIISVKLIVCVKNSLCFVKNFLNPVSFAIEFMEILTEKTQSQETTMRKKIKK